MGVLEGCCCDGFLEQPTFYWSTPQWQDQILFLPQSLFLKATQTSYVTAYRDAVLDAFLAEEPEARVAAETICNHQPGGYWW